MKKTLFTLLIAASILNTADAQKEKKEKKEKKYTKIFYKDSKTETNELVIVVDNAVSTATETKFKLKITNKTNDYVLYKPEESKFVINGKEMVPKEKWLIISPNESDYRVINMKEPDLNAVKSYSYQLDGLYKIPANTKGIAAPDFKLPATKNDFTAGNFSVAMDKLAKETARTEVKFTVKYTGDKIGFIFPSKTAVKMPDGNEYANARSKMSPVILMKGQDDSFVLVWEKMQGGGKTMDMQFAEMFIKWNDVFAEVNPEKMKPEVLEMKFDELLSK